MKGAYFNRDWLDFTGQTMEEQSGDGWIAGMHENDSEARRGQIFTEAFEARRAFECEFRMRRRDGSYRWLLESGRPFYDMDGKFAGYIGFPDDITERKAALEVDRAQEP